MRISDWSSDVCSSDLIGIRRADLAARMENPRKDRFRRGFGDGGDQAFSGSDRDPRPGASCLPHRSEEHTSELQSLMRISYAVFCLKKKTPKEHSNISTTYTQKVHSLHIYERYNINMTI